MSGLASALLTELLAMPDEELRPLAERLDALAPRAEASPFVTADEAAALLRCDRRGVYRMVEVGRLPRHGAGRRLLLRRADVLALASGDVTQP